MPVNIDLEALLSNYAAGAVTEEEKQAREEWQQHKKAVKAKCDKARYDKNPEKRRAENRARWQKNRERYIAKKREYYQTHRAELLAQKREYYQTHRAEILAKEREERQKRKQARHAESE